MSEEVKEMRDGSFLCVNEKGKAYWGQPEGYPTKTVQTTTLMEEQELEFTSDGGAGQYAGYLTEALEIVEGQIYTVNWDGTEYESVCSTNNSFHVLGNLSLFGLGDDTGEPFLYVSSLRFFFVTFDTSASHTISVTTTEEIVIPMAEEFLPDTAANKEYVDAKFADGIIIPSSTADSTKKFRITVDDSGTLSATEVTG